MQLVYFNDLHKNLGCNRGRTAKISIIPVTFTALPVKFYALQLLSAPIFFCPLSPSADKCLAATDISIVQKTCVFRPVDISVPAATRNKLIYQSVYSLSGTVAGNPFRLLTAFAATFPKGTAFGGGGKVSGATQRRPLGGAGERSETEGVLGLMGAAPHPALRATFPRRVKASAAAAKFPAQPQSFRARSLPLGGAVAQRLRGF